MSLLEVLDKQEKSENFEINELIFKNHIERRIIKFSEEKKDGKVKYGSMNNFCKKNGFNRANLSNWLNGKKDLNLSTFFRLCRVLQLEVQIGERFAVFDKSKRNPFGHTEKEPPKSKFFDFGNTLYLGDTNE